MKEETIMSLRFVYDQILASKAALHTIVIKQKKGSVYFQLAIQASTGRKEKGSCKCRKRKGTFYSNGKYQ